MRSLKYAAILLPVCAVGLWSFKITNQTLVIATTDAAKTSSLDFNTSKRNDRKITSISNESATAIPATPISQTLVTKKILTESQTKLLKQFQGIKSKVFLSEQEKQMKKTVLSDLELIKNLKILLLQPVLTVTGSEEYVERNLAVDLLIESSTEGKSAEATEAVFAIIQDKQIEDETISEQERQSMAEVKAELLYTWTAKMPSQIEKVNALIPGPVTAKIWANAQAFQEQNRLESDTFD